MLDEVPRVKGFVTVSRILDAAGRPVSNQLAVDRGWIIPAGSSPPGWGIGREEIPLGENLFVDGGRQLMAYCFGFRAPIEDYTCSKFGIGTGSTAPNVADVALEAPITLASTSSILGNIDGIDFLSPFVVRVSFTLGAADANGYLITERGLFSGNGTLLARHVTSAGINKTSDFTPTLTWRLRF